MSSIEKQWYLLLRAFLASLQNHHLFQEEQTKLAAPKKKTNVHETTDIEIKIWRWRLWFTFCFVNIRLSANKASCYIQTQFKFKHERPCETWQLGKFLAILVKYSRRNWLSNTTNFLGGKRANELIYSFFINLEFSKPRHTKVFKTTGSNFLGKLILL